LRSENLEVIVKWESGAWAIRRAGDSRGPGIRVDSLVMNASSIREGSVKGCIEAVYGLDQEVASQLNGPHRHMLGIGAHIRASGAKPRHSNRTYLMPGGDIQGGVM